MSRWYRAYEGTVTDAKLAEVALVAGCSRSVVIASWHAVLENAATLNDGGRTDIPARRVAAILSEPLVLIETVFAEFIALGLIKDGEIVAWKRRQYESDSSTERSRKHRERKRNTDATPMQRCATPPETETYIPLANANDVASQASPEKRLFDGAIAYLGPKSRPLIGKWRSEYGTDATMAAIATSQAEHAIEPVAFITKTLRLRAKARGDPVMPIC